MRTLGLIPARAGSKRIPDKNLQLVNGRPLVERAIICAQAATLLDQIIVSSDDERVRPIATAHGVEFLLRPAELARDESPMQAVVDHAIEHYIGFDVVCILEPPATFRRSEHIDQVIRQFENLYTVAVRTVSRTAPDVFVHRIVSGWLVPVYPEVYDHPLGTQRDFFRDNGIANAVRVGEPLWSERVTAVLIDDPDRGLDIDTPAQLELARSLAGALDRS